MDNTLTINLKDFERGYIYRDETVNVRMRYRLVHALDNDRFVVFDPSEIYEYAGTDSYGNPIYTKA